MINRISHPFTVTCYSTSHGASADECYFNLTAKDVENILNKQNSDITNVVISTEADGTSFHRLVMLLEQQGFVDDFPPSEDCWNYTNKGNSVKWFRLANAYHTCVRYSR